MAISSKIDRVTSDKPTRSEAEEAVRTLIRWAGDNPNREGLLETPHRVVKSYDEFFVGYDQNPADILAKTFEETDDYDEMVVLKNMRFRSEEHTSELQSQD